MQGELYTTSKADVTEDKIDEEEEEGFNIF